MTDNSKLPVHWLTPALLGLTTHTLKAAQAYAEDYARAALAQRQGEPVAWIEPHALQWLSSPSRDSLAFVTTSLRKTHQDGLVPIYTAPATAEQPAEQWIRCRVCGTPDTIARASHEVHTGQESLAQDIAERAATAPAPVAPTRVQRHLAILTGDQKATFAPVAEKLAAALKELLAACEANPAMQGREYVSVGIAVNDALAAYERRQAAPVAEALTDEQIEDATDAGLRAFRLSRSGARGQQLTPTDNPNYWIARAIERAHGIT